MVVSLTTHRVDLTPAQVVTIDGVPMRALSIETQHGVDRPIGTATITLAKPAYTVEELRARWLNRTIEAQVGYVETGGTARIFAGRIASIARAFDNNGFTISVRANGWAELLDFPSEEDIVFPPNTTLYDIVRSLCRMRGLPMYGGDLITAPTSTTPITLGGVTAVDEGEVIIPRRTSPLRWITQKLELFGYRAFDRPDGMFRWQRVNGAPQGAPVETFTQGANLLSLGRDDSISGMVTWWDVEGASWTDDDGIPIKILSSPASVPEDAGMYVTPPGYVRDTRSDPALVTQALADAVRNAHELDTGGPWEEERWRYIGNTTIQPGDTVAITSDLMELDDARRWVMDVDHTSGMEGIRTTWRGWTGAGTAQAAADDSDEIVVFTGARHVGDEYLDYYDHPSPQGREITFTVTVPETYTAIYLTGSVRGANSYLVGGPLIDATVSKIEVWQGGGDEPVGSATLPSVSETVGDAMPFRLPVPGQLEPGGATVKIISGEDSGGGPDDFEVIDLTLVVSGVGYPVLPGSGS